MPHAVVMTDIVNRTVALYDIKPGPTNGHIVGGDFIYSKPRWSPVFAPEVAQKKVPVPNNPDVVMSAHGPYAGITWADGTVELNEKAFLSPGYLGAVILHELVHFEQMTTVGRGDRMTAVRAEIEAHSKSAGREAATVFGLTPDEEGLLKEAFKDNIRRYQNNPSRNMMSMQFTSGGAVEALEAEKQDADSAFWASVRQGGAIASAATASNQAAAEAARQARLADRLARQDADRREQERVRRAPWSALLEWAGKACSYMDYYPETVPINYQDMSAPNLRYIAWAEQENERRLSEKRRTDALGKQYMLTHSVVMPRDEISSWLNLEHGNLNRCSKSVIEMIRDAPDPVDSRWLVAQLDFKRKGGVFGAILRGISSGLGHAAGALIHGIQAPFVSDGSSSGGEAGESFPPAGRERPTPTHDPYRQNYRQLRGVASGASFD